MVFLIRPSSFFRSFGPPPSPLRPSAWTGFCWVFTWLYGVVTVITTCHLATRFIGGFFIRLSWGLLGVTTRKQQLSVSTHRLFHCGYQFVDKSVKCRLITISKLFTLSKSLTSLELIFLLINLMMIWKDFMRHTDALYHGMYLQEREIQYFTFLFVQAHLLRIYNTYYLDVKEPYLTLGCFFLDLSIGSLRFS